MSCKYHFYEYPGNEYTAGSMTPTFKKKILSYFHEQNFDMLVFQQFSHISSELKPQNSLDTTLKMNLKSGYSYLLP